MIRIGHKLGLYRARAGQGPVSSYELAARTGCAERYVREWLNSQVAGGWGDHDGALYCGVAVFYGNAYRASLVPEWLPALDGVIEKLERGARVADVGCGHGQSTVLMASEFERSRFTGFDTHEGSVDAARANADAAGVSDRVHFQRADATSYPHGGYDLVCFFDVLHDLGDPVGAARHA
jgi:SAM-dependent methyltransferase